MSTKSFKVYCLPLTKLKTDKLKSMVEIYAKIYNHASKFMPSLPEKYLKGNPSELYTKWIKSGIIDYKPIQSGDAMNALVDSVANWKATGHISEMEEPNIIKLSSPRYKIVKDNDNHYGIIIKSEKIYFPLITGNHEKDMRRPEKRQWNLIEHLETAIAIQNGTTELKDRRGRVKKGVGAITYNLKDNSVSIPISSNDASKFKKKEEILTFIGIDRNVRPQNYVSVAALQLTKSLTKQNIKDLDEALKSQKISRNLLTALGIEHKVSIKLFGKLKTASQMKHIKKISKLRQISQKEVGNRVQNIQDTISDQISRKIVNFTKQFPNPVVVFENLQNMEKGKRKTGKSGGKPLRKMLNSWNYGEVKSKTEYKLKENGLWIMEVNPQYTSQRCNKCGAIGVRSQVDNTFMCSACGYGVGSSPTGTIGQMHADINASVNIALRGFFDLYGRTIQNVERKEIVCDSNAEPSENIMNPIPMEMIGVDGIKTRKSETIEQERKIEREVSSIVCGSQQSIVLIANAVDRVPEKSQVDSYRFSSPYKENDNSSGRTEFEEKTNSGGLR